MRFLTTQEPTDVPETKLAELVGDQGVTGPKRDTSEPRPVPVSYTDEDLAAFRRQSGLPDELEIDVLRVLTKEYMAVVVGTPTLSPLNPPKADPLMYWWLGRPPDDVRDRVKHRDGWSAWRWRWQRNRELYAWRVCLLPAGGRVTADLQWIPERRLAQPMYLPLDDSDTVDDLKRARRVLRLFREDPALRGGRHAGDGSDWPTDAAFLEGLEDAIANTEASVGRRLRAGDIDGVRERMVLSENWFRERVKKATGMHWTAYVRGRGSS